MGQVILNGGFENATWNPDLGWLFEHWDQSNPFGAWADDTKKHSGNYAVEIVTNEYLEQVFSQAIPKANIFSSILWWSGQFSLGQWSKGRVVIYYDDETSTTIDLQAEDTDWHKLDILPYIEDGKKVVKIRITSLIKDTWYDDASLIKIQSSEPPEFLELYEYVEANWEETDPAWADLQIVIGEFEGEIGTNIQKICILNFVELFVPLLEHIHIIDTWYRVTSNLLCNVFVRPERYDSTTQSIREQKFNNIIEELSRILRKGRYQIEGYTKIEPTKWEITTDRKTEPIVYSGRTTIKLTKYEE